MIAQPSRIQENVQCARVQKQGNGVIYPRSMIGRTISHYRVLSKLGTGGMGDVYVAEDTRLDRKVAIKLLPAEFTRNAENVSRFIQEAKAASAFNHPNIITVHDVGASSEGHFIVMELVSGRTLRSMAGTDTPLATLLPLFSQMGSGASRGACEWHYSPRRETRKHHG